jgi:hypothetical protein
MKMPEADMSTGELVACWARRITLSVIILGIFVAVAPLLPLTVRHQALVGGLLLWFLMTLTGFASLAIRALQEAHHSPNKFLIVITFIGISTALLAVTQLEIIRILADRPALIWHVDWRYQLSHAQAIAETGGLSRSLDYSGTPIEYHVGPSWIAGAVQRVFGKGVDLVLFGVVPLLSLLTIVIALVCILRQHNVPLTIAAAATAITLTFPSLGRSLPKLVFNASRDIFDANYWTFSTSLMLNSMFALCVGLASFALIVDKSSKWRQTISAIGLSSVVILKPQYFASIGLLTGLLGVGEQIGRRNLSVHQNRILVFSLFSLCCALVFMKIIPSERSIFGTPVFLPGNTGYSLVPELLKGSTFLLIFGSISWYKLRGSIYADPDEIRSKDLVFYTLSSMAIIVITLFLVCIPIREEAVNHLLALGDIAASVKDLQGDLGFGQALTPLRILVVATGFSLLFQTLAGRSNRFSRIFMAIACISVISPAAFVASGFVEPLKGYEAVEDYDLYRLLEQIPRSGTLLISSDIADPAQDYKRPARASHLTAYGGHAFYVADFVRFNFARDDAVTRATDLRAFFGAPWSKWHSEWLANKGVTHIVTDDRCVPCWAEDGVVPLKKVLSIGRWTLYEVSTEIGLSTDSSLKDERPAFSDMTPRYGISDCLLIKKANATSAQSVSSVRKASKSR